MISTIQKIIFRGLFFLIITSLFLAGKPANAQSLPIKCFENQKDYSFMWWMNTIKTNNQIFAIKTNHYSLSFDYPNLALQNLIITKNPVSEEIALRETNAQSFPVAGSYKLKFGMNVDNYMYWCTSSSGNIDECQLIETGKYFHRRFMNKLPDLIGCDMYNSGFEISSWPDRLSLILRATPGSDFQNRGLEMELTFPAEYATILENGNIKALKNQNDGSGYVILKSANSSGITISGTTVKVKLDNNSLCPAGKEMSAGMIIYPVAADIEAKLAEIAEEEASQVTVTALQTFPANQPLNVVYEKDQGWHRVGLRNDGNVADYSSSSNDRMERVNLEIENPTSTDKIVRFNLAKERATGVFGITGLSAVFRDMNGNPVGIPVQLSKNWHTSTNADQVSQPFRGPWYHGLSMLTIPAKTKINLEYTSVNALWGNIPAASHAQLCLVGWGSNQQWDESAIGSWGESITYEPDLDQAGAPLLDFRPLMVQTTSNQKWNWSGNMGGGDFFNYTKTDGTRSWHSRMRTQYKRYSPNYTEVTYAGTMDDNSMDFEYTASIGRSDDLTRGIYRIKLKVLKNSTFKDFVFFQTAAPTYHYTKSNTLAWGNETGLKKKWSATIGGTPRYIGTKQVVEGTVPWFSFTDSQFAGTQADFRPANRGFVIRSWKARINGTDNTPPSFAEYSASGGNGDPSSLINITPPAGCTTFLAGDYIEAEIELFQIPKAAADYYGPNQNLINALSSKANSWEMVSREAMGNDLEVKTTSGATVVCNYPIKIDASSNSMYFSVSGGRGYVPLTIANTGSCLNPVLYQKVNGNWQKINQAVFGNDFWQTDYNAITGKWDITYNVNLDSPNDVRQTVEFKFETPEITTSNLPTPQLDTNYRIYPNPTENGSFDIELTNLNNFVTKVRIVDMQGHLSYEKDFSAEKIIRLNSNLRAGIYLVSVINNKVNCFQKLVVH